MKYNRLGTSGLFVSELSFGTMTFGEMEGQPTLGGLTEQDAGALVAKAFEAGVNLFDTADVYALGDSERFLGEALRNLGVPRESYPIATKAFGPIGEGPNDAGASRGHLLDAAKTSLNMRGRAERHSASVAQIAFAWLLHQRVVSSVIVGAKRMDQLEVNLRSVDVSLTGEEQAAIA